MNWGFPTGTPGKVVLAYHWEEHLGTRKGQDKQCLWAEATLRLAHGPACYDVSHMHDGAERILTPTA